MKNNLFHLEVITIKNILIHEEFDPFISIKLTNYLKKNKVLSNPILVASLGEKQYIQLDGMNRITCFKKLGIKTIAAQIVDYSDQKQIELSSWLHLFQSNLKELLDFIKKDKNLVINQGSIDQVGHRYIKENDFGRLVSIVTKKNEVFFVSTKGNFSDKIKRLNNIVSFYKKSLARGVLPYPFTQDNVKQFFQQYPNFNNIIIFPSFTPQQVIETVKSGFLFPTGITRYIVKGRCLNINVPLSLFNNKKSLKKQNELFNKLMSEKRCRLYEENVINCE
ncbi:hypothetical protein COW98_04880 [Candidatus Roizmanbacteria bacterium CG22_combo_CG10-13_8_21_14_all_35_9]|uniref:ParB/Sulfiredoxin domain-containing protein n=2 Tax=Candidatus Roizmaniibacteriota TaxID=1752723 RepID=A0A2H0BZ39_9BACT|nr:MAG: hypothetical protein COW98_04880 [Candidatus Roizmanbacteria bacterium CG22_combo_CG10-13_8_21_14_all_35_9]PIY71241.1 MAG: hypothetical protein COY88_01380 [Candidatus Roizmanbacteria bacterium CG_4_10_14_0_8_um_filter_35_28]